MFTLIKTVLKHITTEKDGESYCPARLMWAVGNLVFLTLSVWHFVKHGSFDYMQFATGFATVQVSGAGAVKLKETTEQQVS